MPSADQRPSGQAGRPPDQLREVGEILRSRGIQYPVESREAFAGQMSRTPEPVTFGGRRYDVTFVSHLVPDFLFPVQSEQDMLTKITELLVSRGLLPLESLGMQQ